MEENMQHFQHIMLYYFKKGKNATEKQKRFVQYVEKVLWLIERVKVVLKFHAADSRWMMLQSCVEQLKLIAIKSRQ